MRDQVVPGALLLALGVVLSGCGASGPQTTPQSPAAPEGDAGARCDGGPAHCRGSNTVEQPGRSPRGPGSGPVEVPSDAGMHMVAVGQFHTCAVTDQGRVRCWGRNSDGQLGDGSTTDRAVPVEVPGLSGVVEVAAGAGHTCALRESGDVLCWGRNAAGQLGDGSTTARPAPVQVPGPGDVEALVAGSEHTCALRESGDVLCWGRNAAGQLGDGSTTDRGSPVGVANLRYAVDLATGAEHTCARTASGEVLCWGANDQGQLGDGSTENRPTPVAVGLRDSVAELTAGTAHTCALNRHGVLSCWGANNDGQLGDGSTTDRSTPQRLYVLFRSTAVAAGAAHTCAVSESGRVHCWGSNRQGQLGAGTTARREVPVLIDGPSGVEALAHGGVARGHACALLAGGEVLCWGDDSQGQLGGDPRPAAGSPQAPLDPSPTAGTAPGSSTSLEQVSMVVHVMSKCPYGVQVVQTLTSVARQLGTRLDFRLEYVGTDQDGELASMHGEAEVQGDIIQLCVHEHASRDDWLSFLDCQNETWRRIPEGWEQCAGALDADLRALRRCVEGDEGERLLRASFEASAEAGARASPTMFVNGEQYSGGRTEHAFYREICAAFHGAPPTPCQDLPPPPEVPVTVLVDARCTQPECDVTSDVRALSSKVPGARFTEVDYGSEPGREIFERAGLKMLPVLLIGREVANDRDAVRALRGARRHDDVYVMQIGRFDPVAGRWIDRPEVAVRLLTDSRCSTRECENLARFRTFIERQVPRAKIATVDYTTAKGRALWAKTSRALKKAAPADADFRRDQPPGLPIALFDKSIELEDEAFARLERRFRKVGDDYAFQLGTWDPTAEICDNGRDDDGDRRVDCRDPECRERQVCRPERPRELRVFVMSQCPYGIRVLNAMEDVLDNFGRDRSRIDFRIEFVGTVDQDGELSSMHGAAEVEEDLRMICAQRHYGEGYAFMDYVLCRNRSIRSMDWEQCAGGPIDVEVIRRCAEGEEGQRLLRESFDLASALEIRGSPTWLLNNRYEMHGRDPEAIKDEFCEHNEQPECENPLTEAPPSRGGCGG